MIQAGNSSDGLSDKEKVDLLFKNYLNYTSTFSDLEFYEEIALANHTNIFGSNILSDDVPKNPSYTKNISTNAELNQYLNDEFHFDNDWFNNKTDQSGSFIVDDTNIVMKLVDIKLDYLQNESSAFVCFDNSGDNILKNLIPSNYSNGYDINLKYLNSNGVLKPVTWLTNRTNVSSIVKETVNFGGALFDTKNGIVTFYDVDGSANTVFSEISNNFYLSATKYIGTTGLRTFNEDLNFNSALNVLGDVSMESSLDVSKNLVVHGITTLQQHVSIESTLTVESDVSMESSLDVSNDLTVHQESFLFGDVSMGAHLTVIGDVSMQSSLEVSDNLIVHGKSILHQDVSMGAGLTVEGDVSMESSLDISNDLTVHQETFLFGDVSMGARLTVMGDVSMQSSLEVSENLMVHGKSTLHQDVSMESSLDISNDLTVHQESFLFGDVSMGAHLTVIGDVSMQSSLEVSDSLIVHGRTNLNQDVSMGAGLIVEGDVSMESSLDVSENLHVHLETTLDGDVSMGSSLEISNNLTVNQDTSLNGNVHIPNHLQIGNSSSITDMSNTKLDVYASSNGGGFNYDGNVTIGNQDHKTATEVSNSDIELTIYGDIRIKDGGNLVIDDQSSNSITLLGTETKVTDAFVIENDGTSSSLIVNQTHSQHHNIAEFLDNSNEVFVIGYNGKSTFYKDVSINSQLDVSGLSVVNDLDVDGSTTVDKLTASEHVLFETTLTVQSDVSMESTLDISSNLTVHQNTFLFQDVSMGAGLTVMGDVSMESTLDVSGHITTPSYIGIGSVTDPSYSLHIEASDAILLPKGGTIVEGISGLIRYNTSKAQFEGFTDTWQGLGGVIDSDLDTKIIADESNNLLFDTSDVQRMIIDSSGNIGIGTDAVNQYKVDISGNVHLTGTITSDSDRRIKSEIHMLSGCLESIQELNGYSFTRVDLEDNGKKHIGVIAQEVETLYPELITAHERTGIKSVNYNGLSAVLIECVKELKTENQSMRERIHSLEQQVRATTENKDN